MPVLVTFVVFALLPLLWLVRTSLTNDNGFLAARWVGLDNFREIGTDHAWWQSVFNSLFMAVGTIAVQVPLGVLLAVALDRKLRGRGVFRTVYFLPYIVPISVMGIVFAFIFNPVGGIANNVLSALGAAHEPVDFFGSRLSAMLIIIVVNIWAEFGFTMLLALAALQTIPRELYESAALDGASARQQFLRITLPLMRPVLNIIFLLAIVSSMRSFDLVKTLTNGGPAGASDVMFTHIYDLFFAGPGAGGGAPRIGYASAQAVAASAIIAVVVGLYFAASRRALYGYRGEGDER
ncbi:sugar ABC transporter permease [Asanoa sp. NPDC050611]|uniref:carbohydrate ABC transporter permease n=1 Tax=Asanoa sp. NPDC050611 TaxID=3157098 RepID=UPI0034067341